MKRSDKSPTAPELCAFEFAVTCVDVAKGCCGKLKFCGVEKPCKLWDGLTLLDIGCPKNVRWTDLKNKLKNTTLNITQQMHTRLIHELTIQWHMRRMARNHLTHWYTLFSRTSYCTKIIQAYVHHWWSIRPCRWQFLKNNHVKPKKQFLVTIYTTIKNKMVTQ